MSRRQAHPLRALLRADLRMLRRHGMLALYLLLALVYAALLRYALAEAERPRATALLLLTDPATLSLFFMGAMVLYEKNQHLPAALYAGGVKPGAYMLSKGIAAAGLGTLAGSLVFWLANPRVLTFSGGAPDWASLGKIDPAALGVTALCMLLGGLGFTWFSLVPATLCRSLNGFVLAGGLCQLVFVGPAVIDLFAPLPEGWGFHPTVFLARALYAPNALLGRLGEPVFWQQAAAFAGWLLLAALLGKTSAARLLHGKGGTAQ